MSAAVSAGGRGGTVWPLTSLASLRPFRTPIVLFACLLLFAGSCAIPDAGEAHTLVVPDPSFAAATDATESASESGSESESSVTERPARAGETPAADADSDATPVEATPSPVPTPSAVPTLEPIPGFGTSVVVDPAIIEGEFDNGLRYLIRQNDSPGRRAEFRLVVDAGSALETDEQLGGAHYLEHMMFNGTERFPANEMGAVLESFGMAFGADVNAYTSYDETVYFLSMPTDDPEIVELGLDVLLEWAARATIDVAEVDAERGVVIEEWRLRDEGFSGRVFDSYDKLLLEGTDFIDRAPIGSLESISNLDADDLRQYYVDWYRPDLMTVVAVGDFDTTLMEAEIRERFEPLESPADAPVRPEFGYPTRSDVTTDVLIEPDLPSAYIEVMLPGESTVITNLEDLRNAVLLDFAFEMIVNRMTDDIARGSSDLLTVQYQQVDYVRPLSVTSITVEALPDRVAEAAASVSTQVELARRFGFTTAELESVIAAARVDAQQTFAMRETKQDSEYASQLVQHALGTAPATSVEQHFEAMTAVLDSIEIDDITLVLQRHIEQRPPGLLAISPQASADVAPTAEELKEIWNQARGLDLEPRAYRDLTGVSLPAITEPADVVERSDIAAIELTDVRFENGARLLIKPTKIAENSVSFIAISPGGLSLADETVAGESRIISSVVAGSGVGEFGAPELRQILAGKFVQVGATIDPASEQLRGEGSTTDFETMMQLAHLYFTASRADEPASKSIIGQLRPLAESWQTVPGDATTMTVSELRYGDDARLLPFPSVETLDEFDLEGAHEFFIDRFDDAGDFTFIIVGDIDPGAAENLAARYLGTLPSGTVGESARDIFGDAPAGITSETILVGSGDQGSVTIVFEQPFVGDVQAEIAVDVLQEVLRGRLTRRLREGLGATYSPAVRIELSNLITPTLTTTITVSADPDRLDEVVDETLASIDDLVAAGPTKASFDGAVEVLRRDFELISNVYWLDELQSFALGDGVDVLDATRRQPFLNAVTEEQVRAIAASALTTSNYIEVREIPAA